MTLKELVSREVIIFSSSKFEFVNTNLKALHSVCSNVVFFFCKQNKLIENHLGTFFVFALYKNTFISVNQGPDGRESRETIPLICHSF